MGYNHVATGLVAGLATLPLAPVHTVTGQFAWVLGLGGASLLPDLDTSGSTAARMWGPLTRTLGVAVGLVAQGHRKGTHDLVLSPAVFAGASFLASLTPVTKGLALALMIGLVLCGLALSGAGRIGAATNLVVSAGSAWWLVTHGAAQAELALLPLVVAAGVIIHILGDAITTEGVPVPIAWMAGVRQRLSLGLFTVDSPPERFLVAPALSLLGVVLFFGHIGVHDVDSLLQWTDQLLGLLL